MKEEVEAVIEGVNIEILDILLIFAVVSIFVGYLNFMLGSMLVGGMTYSVGILATLLYWYYQ